MTSLLPQSSQVDTITIERITFDSAELATRRDCFVPTGCDHEVKAGKLLEHLESVHVRVEKVFADWLVSETFEA